MIRTALPTLEKTLLYFTYSTLHKGESMHSEVIYTPRTMQNLHISYLHEQKSIKMKNQIKVPQRLQQEIN